MSRRKHDIHNKLYKSHIFLGKSIFLFELGLNEKYIICIVQYSQCFTGFTKHQYFCIKGTTKKTDFNNFNFKLPLMLLYKLYFFLQLPLAHSTLDFVDGFSPPVIMLTGEQGKAVPQAVTLDPMLTTAVQVLVSIVSNIFLC